MAQGKDTKRIGIFECLRLFSLCVSAMTTKTSTLSSSSRIYRDVQRPERVWRLNSITDKRAYGVATVTDRRPVIGANETEVWLVDDETGYYSHWRLTDYTYENFRDNHYRHNPSAVSRVAVSLTRIVDDKAAAT